MQDLEREVKLRKMWELIAKILGIVAAILLVYVLFFKDNTKNPPKQTKSDEKEQVNPVNYEEEQKEENKEETNEEIKDPNKEETEKLDKTYEEVVKNVPLFDKVGDYSIYRTDKGYGYIINDKTQQIIVSGKDSISTNYIYNDYKNVNEIDENQCSIYRPKNCDTYVYGINEYKYFVNKKTNIISLGSYKKINCYFLDELQENLYFCEDNDDAILTYTGSDFINDKGKFGILNTKTGLDYLKPTFKYLVEIGKNKFAGIISSKVGLYTKTGEQLLNSEYDFIGVINTNNEKTYISIKGDEIKLFDENMKEKKLKVNNSTTIEGLHFKYYEYIMNNILTQDVNDNEVFKYKGTDFNGEKYIIVINPGCNEFDEEKGEFINNKDSLIYVYEDDTLKRLNPNLITPKQDLCSNWY